jgi:hypothetical protein
MGGICSYLKPASNVIEKHDRIPHIIKSLGDFIQRPPMDLKKGILVVFNNLCAYW